MSGVPSPHSKALSLAREIERGHEWFTEENYHVLAEAVIYLEEQLEALRAYIAENLADYDEQIVREQWPSSRAAKGYDLLASTSSPAKRPT